MESATWVAQLVKRLTLGFGSGYDLMVCEFKPHVRLCTDSKESAWKSLSLPLSAPAPLVLSFFLSLSFSLSLKINE